MADSALDVRSVERPGSWWHLSSWVKWCPTSMASLALAEGRILSKIWHKITSRSVPVLKGNVIRTISINEDKVHKTPLVLVHGMGSGVGLWALNLEELSRDRPLHAFDVLGFGRSSRPNFSKNAKETEQAFVNSIEEWRVHMKLEKFVLLGHSLGGFIAAAYALQYPQRVKHLVLVDPWGFAVRPAETEQSTPVPSWIKVIATMLSPFNPLAVIRMAGPFGPGLIDRFRVDLRKKFTVLFEDDTVPQYIYHCNAQHPSGEVAFKHLSIPFGWAKEPMVKRMDDLPSDVPITFIYGSRSWIENSVGYEVKYIRSNSYVDVQLVRGAGHHVYADKVDLFNQLVTKVCDSVDKQPEAE